MARQTRPPGWAFLCGRPDVLGRAMTLSIRRPYRTAPHDLAVVDVEEIAHQSALQRRSQPLLNVNVEFATIKEEHAPRGATGDTPVLGHDPGGRLAALAPTSSDFPCTR